ncbi:MAG: hypothetical protein R2855_01505 [Thermomicrobiales bacterium]
MKLVIATEEGDAYFAAGRDLQSEIVRVDPMSSCRRIGDADVLCGRPDAEVLAAAKQLRLVQSQSAGVDFLMNFPELVESDVVLSKTRGAHAPSIAEHAFALLLALTRKILASLDYQHKHQWRWTVRIVSLRDHGQSSIGIPGYRQPGGSSAPPASRSMLAVDVHPVAIACRCCLAGGQAARHAGHVRHSDGGSATDPGDASHVGRQ